ncbi:BRISC and BRCA1-A complex member 1 isoform X2 [Passer montanus]|uniref:BRISC and BRCA1-A complex member 1 isoform X2 n=1 Tax=Passer montanus TaxID=9160 RepID=UPI001961ADFC|nr:BRISC and BRCA1-A complex member 1 isoform X2 [Passer montanus]
MFGVRQRRSAVCRGICGAGGFAGGPEGLQLPAASARRHFRRKGAGPERRRAPSRGAISGGARAAASAPAHPPFLGSQPPSSSMDPSEPGSAAEDEEEKLPEVRPRTRSNPEGAEDRAPSGLGSVGTRGDAVGTRGDAVGTRGEAVGNRGEAVGTRSEGTRAEAVGNRSEGEGEAASAGHSPPGQPGTAWHGPGGAQHGEVTVRTPRVNCPEKVIICLDLAEEMAVPKLESFNGCRSNALTVAQKMIEMFVRTKHKIDKSHEFALVVVNNDATWLSGFTSDPREVCSCLYDLDTVVCQSFNLDGLFNLIQQKVELPVTDNVQTIPPPFVVRTILVFGRPRCQPHFCGGEHVKKLLQCPYFFFDVVYIHNGLDEKEDESSWKVKGNKFP